ncbi:MAG: Abortive infection protein [Bacteroidetes bacterium]|nr:Abortive infection protein [Bacteroidota bacterium]
MNIQASKLHKFLLILCLLSVGVATAGYCLCKEYLKESIPIYVIVGIPYMFVPAISVFIVEKWKFKVIINNYSIQLKNVSIFNSLKYILLTASLLPVLILIFSFFIGNIFGFIEFGFLIISKSDLDPLVLAKLPPFVSNFIFRIFIGIPILTISSLLAGCTINLFFALGEEIAWRGFLEKEIVISKKWRPFLTGIIWGLWHAPLILMGFNYKGYHIWGILIMIIVCIALSYYFSQSLYRTRTLLVPAALHGIINAFSMTFANDIFIKTGNPLFSPPMGLSFALSVAVLIFLLLLFRRKTNEKI